MEKILKGLKQYGTTLILVIMIAFFAAANPNFRTADNLITVLRQVSMLGILSVGLTFVFLLGDIDLSVGVMMGLSATTSALFMTSLGLPVIVSWLLAIMLCTVVGAVNGIIVTTTRMPALIATLGTQNIIYGINYMLCGGLAVYGIPESAKFLGQYKLFGFFPVPVLVMIIVFLLGSFILRRTYYGRYFYAVGGNAEATRLSGININKVKILAYSLCGFCAGIAGAINMSRANSGQPSAGHGFEMDVITACVVGGISAGGGGGKMSGVISGVLIIGVLSNGMTIIGINDYWQMVAKGMVLVLAVGLDYYQKTKGRKAKLADAV